MNKAIFLLIIFIALSQAGNWLFLLDGYSNLLLYKCWVDPGNGTIKRVQTIPLHSYTDGICLYPISVSKSIKMAGYYVGDFGPELSLINGSRIGTRTFTTNLPLFDLSDATTDGTYIYAIDFTGHVSRLDLNFNIIEYNFLYSSDCASISYDPLNQTLWLLGDRSLVRELRQFNASTGALIQIVELNITVEKDWNLAFDNRSRCLYFSQYQNTSQFYSYNVDTGAFNTLISDVPNGVLFYSAEFPLMTQCTSNECGTGQCVIGGCLCDYGDDNCGKKADDPLGFGLF